MCDAGGPNQLSETIGNLGLWTRLGIPTRATRFKTHQTVRFFWISLLFLIIWLIAILLRGGQFLFYSGRAIPTHFRPTPRPQNTKNCDAKCDAICYNAWEIKEFL
jgi:hypothetical protein